MCGFVRIEGIRKKGETKRVKTIYNFTISAFCLKKDRWLDKKEMIPEFKLGHL